MKDSVHIIHMDCFTCASVLLADSGARVLLVGDVPRVPEYPSQEIVWKLRAAFDEMAVQKQIDYVIPHKRDLRKQNQPFYRGLKKGYRA